MRELRTAVGDTVATVPAGFVTDYSFIPFGFRWMMCWNPVVDVLLGLATLRAVGQMVT